MKLIAILAMVVLCLPVALAAEAVPSAQCCQICDSTKCCTVPLTGLPNAQGLCTGIGVCLEQVTSHYYTLETGSCPDSCTQDHEVPEFGTVTALVALAGAATGFFIIKKK